MITFILDVDPGVQRTLSVELETANNEVVAVAGPFGPAPSAYTPRMHKILKEADCHLIFLLRGDAYDEENQKFFEAFSEEAADIKVYSRVSDGEFIILDTLDQLMPLSVNDIANRVDDTDSECSESLFRFSQLGDDMNVFQNASHINRCRFRSVL